MKRYTCDACGKTISDKLPRLKLPIAKTDSNDNLYMIVKKLDICVECANRFMKLYYQIAKEHNHSGIFAFETEMETDV